MICCFGTGLACGRALAGTAAFATSSCKTTWGAGSSSTGGGASRCGGLLRLCSLDLCRNSTADVTSACSCSTAASWACNCSLTRSRLCSCSCSNKVCCKSLSLALLLRERERPLLSSLLRLCDIVQACQSTQLQMQEVLQVKAMKCKGCFAASQWLPQSVTKAQPQQLNQQLRSLRDCQGTKGARNWATRRQSIRRMEANPLLSLKGQSCQIRSFERNLSNYMSNPKSSTGRLLSFLLHMRAHPFSRGSTGLPTCYP